VKYSKETISSRLAELPPEKRQLLDQLLGRDSPAPVRPAAIRRRADRAMACLSDGQRRLWFLDQMMPGTAFYNVSAAVRIMSALNILALRASINEIIRRHEILRTSFTSEQGEPVQVIAAQMELPVPVVDIRPFAQSDREAEALRLAREEAQRPFDLVRTPLIRVVVVQLGSAEWLLLVTMHHIISDSRSVQLFFQELSAIYPALLTGKASPLPELQVQYGDFAEWQRELLQDPTFAAQLAYWRKQLRDIPVLQLPMDHPRPPIQSFRGDHYPVALNAFLASEFRRFSKKEGVTVFITALGVFMALLCRYSTQDDLAIGVPITSRNRSELAGLMGFFVNTLVIRGDHSGEPGFREFIRRIRESVLSAFAHQDVPFEKLVEELQPARDLSHNPLFQVAFQLQTLDRAANSAPGSAVRFLNIESGTAKFDLYLELWETSDTIEGTFEFNTDLFDRPTIERMARHFAFLSEMVLRDPDRSLLEICLLNDAERELLVNGWNNTSAPFPNEDCVHRLFEIQAARFPEAPALIFGAKILSYRVLNERANQLARYLQQCGVAVESRVGLCLHRCPEMVIGFLGILKAGAACLPLDPEYPQDRIAFMIEDAGAALIITDQPNAAIFAAAKTPVISLDLEQLQLSSLPNGNLEQESSPQSLAYVIYTSGSTGNPKGVSVEHRGLCNVAQAQSDMFKVGPKSKVLQFASLSFDASVFEIVMALLSGAALCLGKKDELLPGPPLSDFLRRHGITVVTLPPSTLAVIPEGEFPALETITVAGEECPAELVRKWGERHRFFNLYGPTEATIWATASLCIERDRKPSIGRPIPNVRIYLLDCHLHHVPVGVPGEIYIGGVGVARGYLNRPELTAEKFIDDPFVTGGRLYRSGDLGRYRADGNVEFLGRIDHQIKIRGYRIEPGEIEAALSAHPGVAECVVLGREDHPGDRRLVAYIAPGGQARLAPSEIRHFLAERLPEHLVPNAFVILEALPRTPNGKIERRSLPAPLNGHSNNAESYIAPRTSVEQEVTKIWTEILKIDKIGINDNFFTDLGGHSLLATQVMSHLRSRFPVDLPLRLLFQSPTVAGLAEEIVRTQLEQTDADVLAETLAELGQLSDAEVAGLVAGERKLVEKGTGEC
jgi:amino acid adenylation domain-containing protein